ncbi:MAG TPA: UbiA family prenyltransferase [Tepidisphaeraceae bacterium]|jgi:4-hydroxybenzoate polyprenyltransferase
MSGTIANSSPGNAVVSASLPLQVKLVGELLPIDLSWEKRLWTLKNAPFRMFSTSGPGCVRADVIDQLCADAGVLPYRLEVVDYLRTQKQAGRRLVLVSSLPDRLTQAIAAHLDLFDEIATHAPGAAGPIEIPLIERATRIRVLARAMRPHQWLKNLLLLLPLVLAHQVTDRARLLTAMIAFASFSFCASAVYILNDLLDISADRRHPSKRARAFAAGRASVPEGLILAGAMLCAGLILAALLPSQFRLMLLGYLVLTTAYSLWLKQKVLIDVILLASLYSWRIVAGAIAVDVHLTMWLLAFSMFFFLSLAFAKRYSELVAIADAGGNAASGRGYQVSDLRIIETVGPTSGYLSVLVFCNYLDSTTVRGLYLRPQVLWLAAPILLYWITRVWFMARRRLLDDDPVIYAIRDHVSQLTGVLVTIVVLAAWLPKPRWWPF